MSAAAWGWFLAIVGTAASIAGVVFSWLAWVQAGKAKDAAKEAAEGVRIRETAYEISRLARDAKDVLASVQQGKDQIAIFASNNLLHSLAVIRTWKILDIPNADILNSCVRDIEVVATRLAIEGIPSDGPGLETLILACHEIHRRVCDIAGKLEHLSEVNP